MKKIKNLTPERTGDYDIEIEKYVIQVAKRLQKKYKCILLSYKIVGSYGTEKFDRRGFGTSDIDIVINVNKIPKEIPQGFKMWESPELKPKKIRKRDITVVGIE